MWCERRARTLRCLDLCERASRTTIRITYECSNVERQNVTTASRMRIAAKKMTRMRA